MESLEAQVSSVLTSFLELPHFGHSTDFGLLSSALKALYSGSEGGQEVLISQQSVDPQRVSRICLQGVPKTATALQILKEFYRKQFLLLGFSF